MRYHLLQELVLWQGPYLQVHHLLHLHHLRGFPIGELQDRSRTASDSLQLEMCEGFLTATHLQGRIEVKAKP